MYGIYFGEIFTCILIKHIYLCIKFFLIQKPVKYIRCMFLVFHELEFNLACNVTIILNLYAHYSI